MQITLRTHGVEVSETVVPFAETYEALMFTAYKPILVGSLVLTVILLDPSIVIKDGHTDPSLNLQL
jgi:hypothetical protein